VQGRRGTRFNPFYPVATFYVNPLPTSFGSYATGSSVAFSVHQVSTKTGPRQGLRHSRHTRFGWKGTFFTISTLWGPGCPSGNDAGLTNLTFVTSIPVTTDFFLISCDYNQVPKWFGTHYNLEVPS